VIPIYLNWRNKHRRQGEYTTPETSPWTLGRWGAPINLVAIGWTIFIAIVFSIPPNELLLWSMLLLAVMIVGYWKLCARHHFRGPTREDETLLSPR